MSNRRCALLTGALYSLAIISCGGSDTGGTTPPVVKPVVVPVAVVTVTTSASALVVGGTAQGTAVTMDASGNVLTGRTVTWSSANDAIATVSSTGLVTATGAGTATITATSEGKSASAAITITATAVVARLVGESQRGLTGKALADSLSVSVTTPAGAPSVGTTVTWTTSSGTVSSATAVTDAAGVARVQWLAGTGDATATATVAGATPAVFHSNGRASGACVLKTSPATAAFGLGPSNYTLSLRPTVAHKAIVVFVDFSDAPATETIPAYTAAVITPGIALVTEMSYGRATFTHTETTKWYRMSKPAAAYGFANLTFDLQKAYIQEAMSLADADVDFSPYDVIYVVASPTAAIPVSPTLNAFAGTGVTFDGKEIHNGITFGNDSRGSNSLGASVLAHETGHMMGLVDLYSLVGQNTSTVELYHSTIQKYVGAWSIMGWNSKAAHYMAWEKIKMGFIDANQYDCIDATGGVEEVVTPLETAGGMKAVVVQLDSSRVLVAEVRQSIGSDASLCAFGVLVYSVDATIETGKGVVVIQPSRQSTDQTKINSCSTYWDAPFDASGGAFSNYKDAASGVTMTVMRTEANGAFRIKVKRP